MPTKLPGVLGYEPAFSTYDLNEMLAQRPKPRGFRLNSADRINRDYGPLAYDDPAATAFAEAERNAMLEQRGQPGILSKLLIGGAANALEAAGAPGIFDPDGTVRNQSWGNALRASAWMPQDTIEGIGQAITAPARAYRGKIRDEDMISEGLNVAGNMAIGGSAVPKGSAVARVAANAEKASLPGVVMAEAGKMPQTFRGYRGQPDSKAYGGQNGRVWASSSPDVADVYAMTHDAKSREPWAERLKPSITPIEYRFDNPLVLDHPAPTAWTDIPFNGETLTTDDVARIARERGHDGLVLNNIMDGSRKPATSIASLQPGTTYSAITGDLLFENGANAVAPGVVMAEAGRQPNTVRGYHGTNENFTRFDPSMMGSRGLTDEGAFFFGRSPDLANAYADGQFTVPDAVRSEIIARNTTPEGKLRMADINRELDAAAEQTKAGRVIPADIDTSNFGTWNRAGYRWDSDGGARLKQAIDTAKAEGKSGLTINGMEDATGIRDTQYAVWQPGNVYSATTGDLLFENAKNAAVPGTVIAEAGRQPLDMGTPARMMRAKEQGYDLHNPLFRGDMVPVSEFDLDMIGDPAGIHFTRSPEQAGRYGPNVNSYFIRGQMKDVNLPMEGDAYFEAKRRAAEQASRDGFAGIHVNGADGYLESVVPDPTRIRREDAAFDPSQLDSANILYANSKSSGVPGAIIAQAAEHPNDPVAEILRRYGLLSLSPGQAEAGR